MPPLLQVSNVTKTFDKVVAVDNLTLEVEPGEVLGLLGVNGAGKTTVMNMILGLTIPNKDAVGFGAGAASGSAVSLDG